MIGARASGPDAGFSLLEILVALVIASFVVMAIGGLFALTITLRARVAETSRVEASLVDVEGLEQLLAGQIGLRIAAPTAAGFGLVRPDQVADNVAKPLVHVRLSSDPGDANIQVTVATRVATAELVSFESAALEYLVPAPSGDMNWETNRGSNSAAPVAVRLRLTLRDRVWRPLLWIGGSVASGQASQPWP